MKKLFLIALAALLGIGGMKAQNLPANQNLDVLAQLSPDPGIISLDVNESGLMSLSFNPAAGYRFNTGANVYCTLSRDGQVLSNVQACNNVQITYDGVMNDIWALSFFTERNPEVKVGGTYQVKFDKGFFVKEDNTLSPEVLIYYYIKGDDYYVVPAPEYGKQWESLQEFTMTFPGAERITVNSDPVMEIYNIYGGNEDENNTVQTLNYNIEGNQIKFYTAQPITDAGTWYFIVKEESFTIHYPDGSEQLSPFIQNIYVIPNHGGGYPTLYPEPGELEYFPGTIHVSLPKGCQLLMTDNMGWTYLYPVDANGNRGTRVARFRVQNEDKATNSFDLVYWNDKTMKLDPDTEITPAPGNYELVTPNMLYRVRENGTDHSVSSMTFKYTVYVYDELPCTITPESGSKQQQIKQIKFEFEDGKVLKAYASNRTSASWLTDGVTNYLFNPYVPADEPNVVVFTTPVLASLPGTYKFTSGSGQIEINGIAYILTADYTLSPETGVGEISNVVVLPEVFDIYNTQGILLKKNADVEDLRALPAGIYVAGGQKYVVK